METRSWKKRRRKTIMDGQTHKVRYRVDGQWSWKTKWEVEIYNKQKKSRNLSEIAISEIHVFPVPTLSDTFRIIE